MMKKSVLIELLILVLLCSCGAGRSNPGAIELRFTTSIMATDLSFTSLTARDNGDSILFNLSYATKEPRFIFCFDPPNGEVLRYFQERGLDPGKSSVAFSIPKDKLRMSESISMKFSEPSRPQDDENYLFPDLTGAILDMMGAKFIGAAGGDQGPEPQKISAVNRGDDVRFKDISGIASPLDRDTIASLWFNADVDFGPSREIAANILEWGKNPGLGVRALHARGIDGKGVNVAIIDQNLAGDHAEFAGRIKAYKDFGCGMSADEGSMHGPAVLSLLAGTRIGTAPRAGVYFAAVPSWLGDAQYYADALDWIVGESAKLAAADKIRAVSVSAAPSGEGSPFSKNGALWDEAVKRAEAAGIIVLDCTQHHGFIGPAYFLPTEPENPETAVTGYPDMKGEVWRPGFIFAPCTFRTTAEEYRAGKESYQYTGRGGLSWSIPYVTGVMAMGWQLKPSLSGVEMKKILFETAAKNATGESIIDPPAFIVALSK